jgi:hypothetical protein
VAGVEAIGVRLDLLAENSEVSIGFSLTFALLWALFLRCWLRIEYCDDGIETALAHT